MKGQWIAAALLALVALAAGCGGAAQPVARTVAAAAHARPRPQRPLPERLRLKTERRKREYAIVVTDLRRAFEHDMREQFAALSHLDVFTDDTEGADDAAI